MHQEQEQQTDPCPLWKKKKRAGQKKKRAGAQWIDTYHELYT